MNNTIKAREEVLKIKFDTFWSKVFPNEVDIYNRLNVNDFLELKNAISDINNIITLKTTKCFVERIYNFLGIKCEEIANVINNLSANANGFDVYDESNKILAEVKCNIPSANKNSFGGNQKEAIINDLDHLINGKGQIKDTKNFFKFMVLLGDNSVKNAMGGTLDMRPKSAEKQQLLKDIKSKVVKGKDFPSNKESLSREKVYLYFISIDELSTLFMHY